jgi:hypothetical protein
MFNLTSDCSEGTGLFFLRRGTTFGLGLHRRELSDASDPIFVGWELPGAFDSTSEGTKVLEAFESASDGIKGEVIVSFVEQMGDESAFGVRATAGIGFEAKELLESFDLTTHCMEETVPVLVINLSGKETASGLRGDEYDTVFLGKELV